MTTWRNDGLANPNPTGGVVSTTKYWAGAGTLSNSQSPVASDVQSSLATAEPGTPPLSVKSVNSAPARAAPPTPVLWSLIVPGLLESVNVTVSGVVFPP